MRKKAHQQPSWALVASAFFLLTARPTVVLSQDVSMRQGLLKGVLEEWDGEDLGRNGGDIQSGSDTLRSFACNTASGKRLTPLAWPVSRLFSEESRRLIGRKIVVYGVSGSHVVDQGTRVPEAGGTEAFLVRTIVVLPEASGDSEDVMVEAKLSAEEDSWAVLQMSRARVIVAIESRTGIGTLRLRRVGSQWPNNLIARLATKGLESLRVSNSQESLHWEVASHPPYTTSLSAVNSQGETIIRSRPKAVFGELVMKAEPQEIPLASGYFELVVAPQLLESNEETIEINWIDFYRN